LGPTRKASGRVKANPARIAALYGQSRKLSRLFGGQKAGFATPLRLKPSPSALLSPTPHPKAILPPPPWRAFWGGWAFWPGFLGNQAQGAHLFWATPGQGDFFPPPLCRAFWGGEALLARGFSGSQAQKRRAKPKGSRAFWGKPKGARPFWGQSPGQRVFGPPLPWRAVFWPPVFLGRAQGP
jgi:hypothetical protein